MKNNKCLVCDDAADSHLGYSKFKSYEHEIFNDNRVSHGSENLGIRESYMNNNGKNEDILNLNSSDLNKQSKPYLYSLRINALLFIVM